MIDGSEKRNGSLNFERQSSHVIERRSKLRAKNKFIASKIFTQIWIERQRSLRITLTIKALWQIQFVTQTKPPCGFKWLLEMDLTAQFRYDIKTEI